MSRHLATLSLLCALACQPSEETRFLQRLVSSDEATQAKAEDELDELVGRPLAKLMLTGMQSSDLRIAQFCALRLEYNHFSMEETPRWIEVMRSMYDGKDGHNAFEKVRRALGSTDIEVELRTYDQKPASTLTLQYVHSQLHRQLHRGHIPLLCELTLAPHERRAVAALNNLRVILAESDSYRELVARTLLARPHYPRSTGLGPVRKWETPQKADGYPALLHACLAHYFSTQWEQLQDVGFEHYFQNWLLRWTLDCKAGPSDRDLLLRILRLRRPPSQVLALNGLRGLADPSLIPILQEWIHSPGAGHGDFARLLLAELGDKNALDELRDKARESIDALAYLMQLDAPAARRIAVEHYLRTETGEIPFYGPNDHWERAEGTVLDPRKHLDWLRDHLVDTAIPLETRLRLLTDIRHFRTRSNALLFANAKIFAEAMGSNASNLENLEDTADYFALLEVVDRPRAEKLLMELAIVLKDEDREWALTQLLHIGSPDNDRALIDLCGEDTEWLVLLGRTRTEPVKKHLLQACKNPELEPSALQGLLIHGGLPFDAICWGLEELSAEDKRSIREGRPLDVFLSEFARAAASRDVAFSPSEEEDAIAPDPALLRDPRITAWLLERRKDRSRGDYWSLTQTLAQQGHAGALKEFSEVLRIGRYEWLEDVYPYPFRGEDLSIVPRLIQELESACCRTLTVGMWLERLARDDDFHSHASGRTTSISAAKRWWKEAKGNLHYSHIAEHYVMGKR